MVTKLGLPPAKELAGLDLKVKSIFMLPMSVWHTKYVIIDRRVVLLPSCNVSWECWFEGCLEVKDEQAAHELFQHWREVWELGSASCVLPKSLDYAAPLSVTAPDSPRSTADDPLAFTRLTACRLKILPSPHHQNPRFRPFPWQAHPPPPNTPLNRHTLQLITEAQRKIFLTTPNITSPPFLRAIVAALDRGVNVHMITNDRLMTLEQILTAGTTTTRCVAWLAKQHEQLRKARSLLAHEHDPESQSERQAVGSLTTTFFNPRSRTIEDVQGVGIPVKLHLKLMIVDDRYILLGSGNMDRASWYTSEELGMTMDCEVSAAAIRLLVDRQLDGDTALAQASGA